MLARALRAFFIWLSNRRFLGRLAMATPLIRRMPFRFVAGTTLDQAVEAVRALNATGATATLDVLGESVDDRAAADRAAGEYVAAIERIGADGLDANVSIKLTQMGLDLGDEVCLDVLAPVMAASDRHGVFVRIDMEGSAYTQRTLDIVHRLRAEGHEIGPVIQSYLHRSVADVERLAAERVRTRICKGAYAEPPEIAHQERAAIGDAFVELVGRLLEADAYPGVATHDPEMIERVTALVRERGIGADRYEFQMLYGVRRDLQRQLLADGHRLRIYVPYGTEWWAYFMRRLAERPANVLFVVRSVFGERG
ncbi:MAG TPA: proline dehydrogenase family protein [Candidatus Limnocylindrales bacterium]|nr:proline dehydrogenase family protein [Candidatus Limnocylindrales bacterium]